MSWSRPTRWPPATRWRGRSVIRWANAGVLAALLVLHTGTAGGSGRGADGNFEQRTSAHFVLHQDVAIDESGGFRGSRRFEQQVLDELERAYTALDRMLGLRPERRINVIVYDPDVFDRTYGGMFKFQAGGFYLHVIRIRGATRLTASLSRVLHHELVHAALDAEAPSLIFPGWVNEGLAEWFEARAALGKRGLSGAERQALVQLARQGALPALETLNVASFARLDPQSAAIAYLQSYAVIDHLGRKHGERRLGDFVAAIVRHRHLGRALSRVYRIDLATLDARFQAEWRG